VRERLRAKQASEVRAIFARIAHRYDLLNRLLSVGRDAGWRRALVRRALAAGPRLVLDVCAGTGDVALELAEHGATFGCDFCLPMLARARSRARERSVPLPLVAADALELPLPDGSVDLVTVAFGVRNFADLERGLAELARVLRPGGLLLVLEFSRPRGLLGPLLRWWVRTAPPRFGGLLAGDGEAYCYLAGTIAAFPSGEQFVDALTRVGLVPERARPLTGGVVTLYGGVRPAPGGGDVRRPAA
jgi:demethylmenaquinone methyltransferase/2-methoxy-6-polyprenyl-1,4-benzoquinol methylase